MQIPLESLAPETLRRVVAEYVTRDGTDTADEEVKIEQVLRQLREGKAQLRWDPVDRAAHIVPAP